MKQPWFPRGRVGRFPPHLVTPARQREGVRKVIEVPLPPLAVKSNPKS